MPQRTILALDPSSTRTGYALLSEQEKLLEAGFLSPRKRTDPAAERIAAMVEDLMGLLHTLEPAAVVIEWTTGKVGRRRHHGGGAGLAVYGVSLGALWQAACFYARMAGVGVRVELVAENEWTDGRPKAERTAAIARLYPQYQAERDPGGDMADAIGLGRWWIRRHRFKLYANIA